jgi:hypothetical protein
MTTKLIKIDPKALEAAKAEHGVDNLRLVRTGGREYLLKRPSRGEYQRFRKESSNDRMKDECVETLVLDTIVIPSRDEFIALLDELPGLCEELVDHVLELAGLTGKAQAGKL